MPCLLVILSIFFPRFVLLCIWLFTHAFSRAYQTWIWPVLGFFLMPFTTLTYLGAMEYNNHAVSGGWTVLMIVAIIADIGSSPKASSGSKQYLL